MFALVDKKLMFVTVAVGIAVGAGGAAFGYFTASGYGSGSAGTASVAPLTIRQITPAYDSIPAPLALADLDGVSQESGAIDELGNEVELTSTGTLSDVTVTMLSLACQSGNYRHATTDGGCDEGAAPGASFSEPITLTLYQAGAAGAVGSEITQLTRNFNIPFLPSYVASCDNVAGVGSGGYESSAGCEEAIATSVTFNLSASDVAVTSKQLVYAISYPTTHHGPDPFGEGTACWATGDDPGCPYDELNVGLSASNVEPTLGTDTYPGQLDMNTPVASYYCDHGAAGSGTFRLDSPGTDPATCPGGTGWSEAGGGPPYDLPAVRIDLAGSGGGSLYPGGPSQPIGYAISNPNESGVYVGSVTTSFAAPALSNVGTSPASGACTAGMYSISQGAPLDSEVPPGTSFFAPAGASISMTANGDQDNCENATVNLAFATG